MTKASENEFPQVTFAESAAPSTPASGLGLLYEKTDGKLYFKNDAGTETEVTNVAGTGGDAFYTQPAATNVANNFSSSATTVAVTVVAPGTTDKLVAFCSATRTCDSITQTNVTWTRRFQGNGNSNFITVFTGVASSSAGTTATFNFTGSGSQEAVVFTVNSAASAFTACASVNTATGTATTQHKVGAATTVGNYYLAIGSANSAAGSVNILSQPWRLLFEGGLTHGGIFRATSDHAEYAALPASSVAYYIAICSLT